MNDIALITGSTGGLGTAIARRMAGEGYRLILHYHQQPEKAKELAASLPVNGAPHIPVTADLRSEPQIEQMMQQIQEQTGHLDVLINNAGIPFSGLSWKQNAEQWDEIFSVNTRAPWLVSKYSIP